MCYYNGIKCSRNTYFKNESWGRPSNTRDMQVRKNELVPHFKFWPDQALESKITQKGTSPFCRKSILLGWGWGDSLNLNGKRWRGYNSNVSSGKREGTWSQRSAMSGLLEKPVMAGASLLWMDEQLERKIRTLIHIHDVARHWRGYISKTKLLPPRSLQL